MLSVVINICILYLGWRLTVNPPDFYLKLRYGNTNEEGRKDNYEKGMLGVKVFGTVIVFQFLYHFISMFL